VANFPTSLDSLSNPTATTRRNDVGYELHAVISTLNDIAETIEAKVGIGSSIPTTAGDVLHATGAGATTYGPRAMVRLAETILAAPAASISFASIPATYRHLMIEWLARDVSAGTTLAAMFMTFNGDASASYDYQLMTANGATVSSAESLAQSSIRIGNCIQGGAVFEGFGCGTVWIPRYAGLAHQKMLTATAGGKWANATNSMGANTVAGFWRNDSPITTVTLFASGSPNLAIGSMATLYGIPA
jgi:hypothetical protein